jgi:phosphoribosyl 1,2-cyclic phosphodiesterase
MAIRLTVLGSGSGGNATLVEGGGARVLIDAGFSCKSLVERLRLVQVEPEAIDALLITHEHGDHVAGAAIFATSFAKPIYCTAGTARAAEFEADGATVRAIDPGRPFEVAALKVSPFAVPHDAAEAVGFVLETGLARAGYVTDLGHGPGVVREALRDCDLLVVESNYDHHMLRYGPYPERVKERVLGRHGHLDNEVAAEILAHVTGRRTRAIVLAHLSRTNNSPDIALGTARRRLMDCGRAVPRLHAADQEKPSPWFEV